MQLILLDDNQIFRLGLRTALERFPELQVVAEADTAATALEIIGKSIGKKFPVDLVILELDLCHFDSNNDSYGLQLCQQLKSQYPNLPILLLTSSSAVDRLVAARDIGVNGYCPKRASISVIVKAMHEVVSGKTYWAELPAVLPTQQIPRHLHTWRHHLRQYGLRQIDQTLTEVTSVLQNPHLSLLNWLFWSGRKRELKAARRFVTQFLPADIVIVQPGQNSSELRVMSPDGSEQSEEILHLTQNSPTQPLDLFDMILAKLQLSVENLTDSPLEIDILREEKKRELLNLIVRQLKNVLDELHNSQVQPAQLVVLLPIVVRDLWQASTTDFFGKYYTLPMENRDYEVVNVLLQDAAIVQEAILDKIPLVFDLFAYLLFQTPLRIDNAAYTFETLEAIERAEALLQNLIIQVANGVMQPLLNHFADAEIIKQLFYDRRLISSREIASFRNNLSWKYRLEHYIGEPKAIFESRYNLLGLSGSGIKKNSIYAPRNQDLEQVTGIPLAFTLILETRDAIAPRLRSAVSFLGNIIIYILTKIVGRAIGLIARGIIQGIGNSLQETRFGKNSDRQK
ncbi:MAG: DUF3685 domain-containing protein [Chamaesiphon sp.]